MAPTPTILAIEDEEDILALLHYSLSKQGFRPLTATCGEDGVRLAREEQPDLILLDLMLPGLSGIEVCRRLKKSSDTASIPVIMLTAKGEDSDIVAGLEAGADDYVTKPFSNRVLIARIQTVLRRLRTTDQGLSEMTRGPLCIIPRKNEVLFNDAPIPLTRSEFLLLELLARKPGWVFTRNQIMDGIHGDDYAVTERAVDVMVVGLRKKLGEAGTLIETVRGLGYRFREQA